MTTTPILLFAHFLPTGYHVALRIRSDNAPSLSLSIIHETVTGEAKVYTIMGDGETQPFLVQDNEAVFIVVRDEESRFVASAVFQVATPLIEQLNIVLSPISLVNCHVDQCEFGVLSRAAERALSAVFAHTPEEGAQVL
ncbi:hypothetical protein KSF_096170 [Reticulibacter mediterranei]|uniref:Uncharacterized protein n=1 Tax=Reticulibacter mediterranei TaxID=2778369 RepID=A0A8J3IPK5_9CHLR|nr:hypothetical protein [Reticulibacter mediterranei]GHO99569.1 hypothetical protein KSF_096170 [Reticulibacter mediterranei]